MRMIVVSQIDQTDRMRGLVTTLAKHGATIAPVSAPIIYRKLNDPDAAHYGELTSGTDAFEQYRSELRHSVDEGYCSVIRP